MHKRDKKYQPISRKLTKIALRDVAKFADAIHNEYCRRKLPAFTENREAFPYGMPPSESATNFVKREVYRLALIYREKDCEHLLRKEAEKIREWPISKEKSFDNVFNAAFLCVFAEDQKWVVAQIRSGEHAVRASSYRRLLASRAGVSAQDRELFVKQLEYADRHDVPPGLLCGFLLQSGNPRLIRKKLADVDYREPAWVISEMVRLA